MPPESDAETLDPRALRNCFGSFATGVTVVTCIAADGRPQGVTANSFSSVSLAPPLVQWSIARSSSSLAAYLAASAFAINILTREQQDLSNHFARSEPDLFETVDSTPAANGAPLLPGALAQIECDTEQVIEAGDHHIILGRVTAARHDAGAPLLFFSGGYANLAAPEL
jgi:flavin reductase (DIM6/NTAB) family NADH-FMN oxidoreductase RutF